MVGPLDGKQYNGTPITDHSPDDGFEQPSLHWTPVIAPSDMIFYRGKCLMNGKTMLS